MPSSTVAHLLERVAKLEAKVESLLNYQKWQTGLLAGLILMAVKALLWK